MVWISFGRRQPRGYGYGGYPQRGGGGGCLRDLLLLETGCCLAEALGCGPQLLVAAPVLVGLAGGRGSGGSSRAVAAVELYRSRVSSRRVRPCCRMTPSCSTYSLEALRSQGTARGLRLTLGRLLRCRPGGPTGRDPVPACGGPARR
jgi:putative membrane protein insertion efficiency factor